MSLTFAIQFIALRDDQQRKFNYSSLKRNLLRGNDSWEIKIKLNSQFTNFLAIAKSKVFWSDSNVERRSRSLSHSTCRLCRANRYRENETGTLHACHLPVTAAGSGETECAGAGVTFDFRCQVCLLCCGGVLCAVQCCSLSQCSSLRLPLGGSPNKQIVVFTITPSLNGDWPPPPPLANARPNGQVATVRHLVGVDVGQAAAARRADQGDVGRRREGTQVSSCRQNSPSPVVMSLIAVVTLVRQFVEFSRLDFD